MKRSNFSSSAQGAPPPHGSAMILTPNTPNPLLPTPPEPDALDSSSVAFMLPLNASSPLTTENPLHYATPSEHPPVTASKEQTTSSTEKAVSMASNQSFTRDEHRAFVSAIFDIGLKESSPLAVLDHMSKKLKTQYEGGLNLERLKSKLQKYRMKKNKGKEEFMSLYDETLGDFLKLLALQKRGNNDNFLPPIESLSSGEVPAYLTYSVISDQMEKTRRKRVKQNFEPLFHNGDHPSVHDTGLKKDDDQESTSNNTKIDQHKQEPLLSDHVDQQVKVENDPTSSRKSSSAVASSEEEAHDSSGLDQLILAASQGDENMENDEREINEDWLSSSLSLPSLTAAEKQSPIGRSFINFMGLFKSLEEELIANRLRKNSNIDK